MEINGNLYRRHKARSNSYIIFGILLLCFYTLLSGCRTVSKTSEDIHSEKQFSFQESNNLDTIKYTATATENSKDSAEVRTNERATIRIGRDSVGRIVKITTEKTETIRANVSSKTAHDRWFYGLNATRYSEVAGSVDTIEQTKKEKTKDYKFGTSLETYILLCLFGIIMALYIGDYLYRIWKKKQEE